MLHPKTDEHVNPSVDVHHFDGKLSTAETLLMRNVKFIMFVIKERLYAYSVYQGSTTGTVALRTFLNKCTLTQHSICIPVVANNVFCVTL